MAETIYNLYEAKTQLSQLVDRAAAGEEIIIGKNGKPLAKLVPAPHAGVRRKPGGWKGKVFIRKDFDAPLPVEMSRAFERLD
jgi:prevent-host-death family protein